jgi:hypothetical protein
VTDDAEALDAVMETIEPRRVQLAQPLGNDAALCRQAALEAMSELDVEAVREQVPSTKPLRVPNQLVELESDGGIVRRDDRTGTDADERVDWNPVLDELSEHADVCGSAKPTRAEHDRNTDRGHWWIQMAALRGPSHVARPFQAAII